MWKNTGQWNMWEAEMLCQHCSKGYSLGCYLPTHQNKSEPFIPEQARGALLTQALGDMEELVNVRVSREKGLSCKHFCYQGANSPHVHRPGEKSHQHPSSAQLHGSKGWASMEHSLHAPHSPSQPGRPGSPAVFAVPHQQLRGSVPAGRHVVRVNFPRSRQGPGKSKVTEFHNSWLGNQYVLWLNIAMDYLHREKQVRANSPFVHSKLTGSAKGAAFSYSSRKLRANTEPLISDTFILCFSFPFQTKLYFSKFKYTQIQKYVLLF